MPPWCTCLFCKCWLGNVQRFITRAEPLYDSLNPLFCDPLLWSIKSHDLDLSVFCVPLFVCLYIYDLKPKSHLKISSEQLSSSTLYHLPLKYPEIRPGIFILFFMAPGFLVEW